MVFNLFIKGCQTIDFKVISSRPPNDDHTYACTSNSTDDPADIESESEYEPDSSPETDDSLGKETFVTGTG